MRFVASVSLAALALAGCAASPPATAAVAPAAAPEAAPGADALPFPLTPAGAQQFITAAEKDLGDFSVIGGKAAWVNATYITDDTDALAAYFGTLWLIGGIEPSQVEAVKQLVGKKLARRHAQAQVGPQARAVEAAPAGRLDRARRVALHRGQRRALTI